MGHPAMTLEELIAQTTLGNDVPRPVRRSSQNRKKVWWIPLLADVVAAGVLLCLFALFQHVLPQTYESVPPTPAIPSEQVEPESVDTSMGAKFHDKFTATVEQTENSYTSPNIALTVEQRTQGEGNKLVTYYVADIYIRHIENFRSALAGNSYGHGVSAMPLKIATENNAVLAITGDYYGLHSSGPVLRNGVLYRNKNGTADVCVLYKDGTMKVFGRGEFDAQTEAENGAWQIWSFGPSLLTAEGKAKTKFNSPLAGRTLHPRCAIGYYEPGHYVFVVVDGRKTGYSIGLTVAELSTLMESLGCTAAYNLDGGQTAAMIFNDALVDLPDKGGRKVSDIVYIGEVDEP